MILHFQLYAGPLHMIILPQAHWFHSAKTECVIFSAKSTLLLCSLPQLQHHSHPIAQAQNCVISLSLLLLFFSLIWVICEPNHIKLLFKFLISFSSTLSILIHFTPHRDYQNSMTHCMLSLYIVLYICIVIDIYNVLFIKIT